MCFLVAGFYLSIILERGSGTRARWVQLCNQKIKKKKKLDACRADTLEVDVA